MAVAGLAGAEEPSLTARVDRVDVVLGDTLTLQLTLTGERAPDGGLALPALAGFDVAPAGKSENFSFVNGAVSRETIYNYVLTPLAAGTHTIPPFILNVKGRSLATEAIAVTVRAGSAARAPNPGTAPPSGGADLFVTTTLDKKTAVVGEALTLRFRFYNRAALLGQPNYQPPETSGFLAEEGAPQRQFTATVDGKTYQVAELTTLLFPLTPGRARIGPAVLECAVRGRSRGGGGIPSFFDDFFASGQRVALRSDPLDVDIRPLPAEGRPAGYGGAVGRYKITARLDKPQAALHEPVSLLVTVEGEGNLKALPDPLWPPLDGFKKYETLSSPTGRSEPGRGAKVFTTVLKPEVSGNLVIPPIRYPFYEPGVGYREAVAGPLRLTVTGSVGGDDSVTGGGVSIEPARELAADIRYIHRNAVPRSTRGPWRHRVHFKILLAGPVFLFLLIGLIRGLRRRGMRNPFAAGPARRAKSGLARAAALSEGPTGRLEAMHRAFLDYLEIRLSTASSGLTLPSLRDRMLHLGCGEESIQKAAVLWERFEQARYAPGGPVDADVQDLARAARESIDALEKGATLR